MGWLGHDAEAVGGVAQMAHELGPEILDPVGARLLAAPAGAPAVGSRLARPRLEVVRGSRLDPRICRRRGWASSRGDCERLRGERGGGGGFEGRAETGSPSLVFCYGRDAMWWWCELAICRSSTSRILMLFLRP